MEIGEIKASNHFAFVRNFVAKLQSGMSNMDSALWLSDLNPSHIQNPMFWGGFVLIHGTSMVSAISYLFYVNNIAYS